MSRSLLLVSLVLLLPIALAEAQTQRVPRPPIEGSPHELRQENERLRDRVTELEAELADARKRIAKLEESARATPSRPDPQPTQPSPPAASTPAAPTDELSGLPDDPFASPDAMLLALRTQYHQALGDMPRETDAQAQQLIRDARRWARQVGLEKRKPIEWTVRVLAVAPSRAPGVTNLRDSGEAVIEVIDPATGLAIGSPFTISLESREIARLRDVPVPSKWIFGGVFAATPSVDESRAEPGLFNVPKLIGPFVAFGYELSVRSMRPLPQEQGSTPTQK